MTTLKIVFKTGDTQTVLYAQSIKQMWQVESHVLERLGEVEKGALTNATFSKYWIDDEGDRIEIINEVDFDFFIKESGSKKTPKIYFEATPGTQSKARPETLFDENSLSIHPTVECDVCSTLPIRGFRYKCLQCPNFDLCMKCEAEMKHADHLMLRIPNTNSPKLETVCPISGIFGRTARRQQKLAARAAAAVNAAALGAEASAGEGKSRHHRHHRRQCSGGAGLLSNFYDMMQDLAEGGVAATAAHESREATPPNSQASEQPTAPPQQPGSPIEQVLKSVKVVAETAAKEAATAAAAASVAAAAAANRVSRDTNTATSAAGAQTSQTSTPTATTTPTATPVTPSLENLIDPQFMKAGIQILNNFSEMFGKILDPAVTEGTSRNSSLSGSVPTVDLTAENGAAATPPPTAAETPNKAGNSRQSSNVGSGLVTPMETEQATNNATEPSQTRSRNSQSEENDWTMIDPNVAADAQSLAAAAASSAAAASAAAAATAGPIDFVKLSQQLQSHIQSEMESNSFEMPSPAASITPPQVSVPLASAPALASIPTPAPAPPAAVSTERRAVAVFHADPRINNAVHGMMAMGFSNEGAVLTQLLESVDGSIPRALDLMSAAQGN